MKDHSALGPSPWDLQVTRTSLRLCELAYLLRMVAGPGFGSCWQCWRWRFGLFDRSIDSCGTSLKNKPSIAATNSVIIDPSGKCTLWAKPGPPPKACSSTVMTAATSGTGTDGTACKRKPMSKTTHAIIMKLQIQAQAKQRIQFSSHLWWARLMMQTSSFGKSNVQHWRQMFKPWFMTDHHEASNNIVRYILRFKKQHV